MKTAVEVKMLCSCCLKESQARIRILNQDEEYLLIEMSDPDKELKPLLIHIKFEDAQSASSSPDNCTRNGAHESEAR